MLQSLGPYRILKLLGEGGMGAVYHAEDEQLRRPVALKVMRPEIGRDPDSVARFRSEARAAAQLKHDHIVTIYHVGDDAGVQYLAMEFLKGKSLYDWLQPDRVASVSETITIGRQIARGLAAAHAAGLIHRDIKPANIWLEAPRGRVKILDFGLARPVDGRTAELTASGAVLGTPAFMSPEQARGDAVDFRTDLFSLGCILYRMLTGRQPFTGNSVFAVLSAVAASTPTPIRELNPSVPSPLAELVERLLSKSAEARPASAQAVVDELQSIDRGLRSGAEPTGSAGVLTTVANASTVPTVRAPRRRWTLLAFAAATAAAIAVGLVIWSRSGAATNDGANTESDTGGGTREQDATSPPDAVNLLERVDLDRDGISGRWNLRNGALFGGGPAGEEPFHFALPWDPPQEYRLEFTAMRLSRSNESVVVGLACGEHRWSVLFDVSRDGSEEFSSGITGVDGESLFRRSDARRGRVFPPRQPVRVVCTVRPAHVDVTANGSPVCLFEGDLSRLDRGLRFRGRNRTAPLLIGGRTPGAIEFADVVLVPLGTDRGKPLAAPAGPP